MKCGKDCKSYLIVLASLVFLYLSIDSVLGAVAWNNFGTFSLTTIPYAINGPGCVAPGMPSSSTRFGGQGCPGSDSNFDLGAVWIDYDSTYIAWDIKSGGANFNNAKFCNPGGPTAATLIIQFDKDNNPLTGCTGLCYPGADYRIILNGTNSYFQFFQTTPSPAWITNLSVPVNTLKTCGTGDIKIAINKTDINGLLGKVNFDVVTAQDTAPTTPSDSLGSFGDNKMMFFNTEDTMFSSQDPCKYYSGQNSINCTTNIASRTGATNCTWNSFDNICNPNFGAQSCANFCGACINATDCTTTGGRGKCKPAPAPPMVPLGMNNFSYLSQNSVCVEDQALFLSSSGGSCDSDCQNCYSERTCNVSAYPTLNAIQTKGCAWNTDPQFSKSWCEPSFVIYNFACGAGTQLERCFNQTACLAVNGNWTAPLNLCWNATNPPTDQIKELCYDGADNDGNGFTDCYDLVACQKDAACGGDVNVLVGDYGTNELMALGLSMFKDMDPSPPVSLFSDGVNVTLPQQIDARQFMIKDMGTSLGIGIGVTNMSKSLLCTNAPVGDSGRYYYFLDTDANTSTGCWANISNVVYNGFDYRFEYQIRAHQSAPAQGAEFLQAYRCLSNGNFSLFRAKMAGGPTRAEFGGKVGCITDNAILSIDKKSIGNPKGKMRFIVATSDNATGVSQANDTLMGLNNAGIYYTPGTVDFKPKDCFSNPSACGTAFSTIGGGKFMPFEDCFPTSGDEDLDGLTNCADSDCSMAPWCAGTDYTTNDQTAPTVNSIAADAFNNFVFLHWVTNEPTNATITFHSSCVNSTAVNTIYELGNPSFTFDDYRPWHDLGIRNGTTDSLGGTISMPINNTKFYKLKSCDRAGNCATSGCLNFTTSTAASNVQYRFNFVAPSGNALLQNTAIKIWNGTAYESVTAGQSSNRSNYLNSAKLKFEDTTANWSIELEGVNLAKAVDFNMSSGFNVTSVGTKTHVGLNSQKYQELAQNLGATSILLKIPGLGTKLTKCNENNISDCSDVSAQAEKNETNVSGNYVVWRVPTSLGFSMYSNGNETFNFTFSNLTTVAPQTISGTANATYRFNVTNWDNTTRMYNITATATGATSRINGSSLLQVNLTTNTSAIFVLDLNSSASGDYTAVVFATLYNDPSVVLNSTSDLLTTINFTVDAIVPSVVIRAINTKSNNSWTNNLTLRINTTVVDGLISYWNITIHNMTNTSQVITSNRTAGSNISNLFVTLNVSVDGNYTVNLTAFDTLNNSNSTLFVIRLDTVSPTSSVSCDQSSITVGTTITCTCTAADALSGVATQTFSSETPSVSSAGTFTSTSCTVADNAGNSVVGSGVSYTVTAASSSSSSGGGATGTGGGSSSGVTGQFEKKVWSLINAGETATIEVKKDGMTAIKIEFKITEKAAGAWVNVKRVEKSDMPSSTSSALSNIAYQYMEITKSSSLKDTAISEGKIEFKVEKSWLTQNKLDKNAVALFRYADSKWNELKANILKEDDKLVYYSASTPGFSYFAVGKSSAEPVKEEAKEEPLVETKEPTVLEEEKNVSQEPTAPSKFNKKWLYWGLKIFLVGVAVALIWLIVHRYRKKAKN